MTPSQRVLVVDAESYCRDTIRDVLAADGVACDVAASAAEVRKAIEDPRVACVVLDVRVAAPDAIGLLEALLQERPALRVIALSSHTDQELILAALRSGACDYLAKPIHDEELCLAVRRALAGHAVESRWDSARERLVRMAMHGDEIERAARAGADREELAARVVTALAEVLGAARASLLRVSEDGARLRVEASEGPAAPSEDAGEVGVAESIAGLAVREGRALLIDDLASDPRCAGRGPRPHRGCTALALAPLDSGAGVHGVLCAADRWGGGVFGGEDLALLRLLARDAERWLDPRIQPIEAGAQVEEGAPPAAPPLTAPPPAADADAEVELLRAIADGMTREIEPGRLLAASLRPVARATSARVVSLYLIDNASGRLVCEAQCEGTDVDRAQLPRDVGLTGGSLQSGAIVATDRPERDPRFDRDVDTPEGGVPGPLLVIPLRVRERVLGVARVFPGAQTGASAHLGELLAAPLSAATRNVLLYRSLLDSVDDVARARRESEGRRSG